MDNFIEVSEDRPGKDHAYLMASTKATKTLNWKPKYSLEQGVSETVLWIEENLSLIRGLTQEYIHKK